MTFGHPWFLLSLVAPVGWMVWTLGTRARKLNTLLKGLGFAAILFALAEPAVVLPQTKAAEVVLVDTSASITPQDLTRESSLAAAIERARGSNWVRIVPFDSGVRPLELGETSGAIRLQHVSGSAASGTNLEAALTGSTASMPNGYVPGFLLISDGNENQGSVLRAIAQLRRLQIPVDTIPLGGRASSGLHLQSASLPQVAFSGEQIPIDLTISASARTGATVDLSAEGKALGHQSIELQPGTNSIRLNARVRSAGVVSISGKIQSPGLGETQFEQAIKLRRARVLYLSQDPPGTDANLTGALTQANIDIVRESTGSDKDLNQFQLVILNNLDLSAIPASFKASIDAYVRNGGGLLLIGGERQVYKEDKKMDALDRVLPAKLAPPDTPKGTSVALIIDKSSSMEGRKIELARLSAVGVVDHLRPIDSIGVLIFDNSYQWAVPMRLAQDKSLIKRLISGITPDGGTQIAPALAEAYRKVSPTNATFKHIVLLTDGISEEGDSIDLAKEAMQHQVTISTVGLGQDVNRGYLEKIAATSGGRSYFLNEPMGLEQILLKDVEAYSGSTAVEKSLTPLVAQKADVLDGVKMDSAPALHGYARYVSKPDAQTLLEIDPAKKDPLYVRWQYGLGRAAVFTSDAKSRWAEAWMNWPGFDRFWINVTRDLLMDVSPSEATAEFDAANDAMLVRYRLSSATIDPATVPPIYALGPNGFEKPVEVKRVADRLYEGRLRIGSASGLYRVRPLRESAAFPEVGFYREQREFEDFGSNEELLKEISAFTNGRYNPPVEDIFRSSGRGTSIAWQLWPAFLGLAILLTIAELVARKWSRLAQRFRIHALTSFRDA